MAPRTSRAADAATPASRGGDVKMVKRHAAFQEPDVEATQAAADETTATGPNPNPKGTARWSAFENRKRQDKGLPATNAVNE